MKITILGTGTSQGVPVIGCTCEVCTSNDPYDNRLRSSVIIHGEEHNVLIDAGPDFRQQMLRTGINHLEAILLTHEHNDHVIGLDDIRPFNHRTGREMAVYALPRVADEVKRRFQYIFENPIPGLPRIQLHSIDKDQLLTFGEINIQTIGIMHGRLPILGFRCGDLAYLTDVKSVEPSEFEKLKGVKYLIVNALHHEKHPTHFNLEEALAFVESLSPQHAWLTHLSHHMGLSVEISKKLPPNVSIAYDGLVIDF
ncbi:MAG: MBL fold metallo-hydrolase [Saprospiraceae bacterium]